MMTEDEFYEWFAQVNIDDDFAKRLYQVYVKSYKYEALVEHGVDNWSGFGDAMQSLEGDDNE